MTALKHWRFETRDQVGAAMAKHLYYTFNFRIQGQSDQELHYLRPGQWIEMEYTLMADGRTKDVKVIDQSEPDLPTKKAVEQLKEMKLQPVTQNGVPVEMPHMKIRVQ